MPHHTLKYAQTTLLPHVGELIRKAYPQFAQEGWNSELTARLHDYGELLEVIELFEKCHWERVLYTGDSIELYINENFSTNEGLSKISLAMSQERHIRISRGRASDRVIIFTLAEGTLPAQLTLIGLLKSLIGIYAARDLERSVLGKTKAELVASSLTIRLEIEEILGASLDAFDLILASYQPA
jgi:hypothetical protein